MSSVDRNLLRLALYEMLEVDEVAVAVTIDESVELAKAYGSDDSFRFINGLLGRVARRMDEGIDVVAAAREELAARNAAEQQAAEDVEDAEAKDADEDAADVEDAATESVTDDVEDGE